LSKKGREFTKLIAAFGTPISAKFLTHLRSDTDLNSSKLELEEAGVIEHRPDGLIFISHQGTRSRVYRSLQRRLRRDLHERIYHISNVHGDLAKPEMAVHASAAGLYAEAADLFRNEGQLKFDSGNYRDAQMMFARAIDSLGKGRLPIDPELQILYGISL